MALKDILVQLDGSKGSKKRQEAAIALAAAHDAHLVGLAALGEPNVPAFILNQIPAQALESHTRLVAEALSSEKQAFEKAADAAGIAYEARGLQAPEGDLARAIALHARYVDLAIMGQHDPDDSVSLDAGVAEEVLFAAGRPLLMIPYIGAPEGFGRHATVAWDAGREATRAVNDALPLLERAEKVDVVAVNPRGQHHGEEPGADIALHLARHGVQVNVEHLEAKDIDIADALLSRMADSGTDLMVMGAYGHSRVREMVLGGVTRAILQHMTVPVLMSH